MPRKIMRFVLAALGIGGSLSLTMCGGGEGGNTGGSTQCPNGICGPGSGGGSSSSSSSGTMMSSSSGMMSSSSSSSSTSTSGGNCTSAWLCTPWDTGNSTPGASNMATRQCTDKNNCAVPTNPPASSVTLPSLDVNFFECKVEPILDKKCGMLGCHGTETGRSLRVYSRARLREATAVISSPNCGGTQTGTACIGSNSCPCDGAHVQKEWQRNYDAARGFALDDMGNALSDESQSDLIQQPVVGGKSHAGIHLFKNGDADYTTILNWLQHNAAGTLASCNPLPN